ncbi:MAG: hypothetical protein ACR2PZ_23830, partial [Pseudomonadales bacterium]
ALTFHRNGVIDDEEYSGWGKSLCDPISTVGYYEFLTKNRANFADYFLERIDTECGLKRARGESVSE